MEAWHGWEDVKIYLWEFWCNYANWIHLAQNALHLWICVKTVMSLQVPSKTKKCLAMSEWLVSFSKKKKKKKKTLMCEVSGEKWIIQVLEKQSCHSLITVWWHVNWQVNIFTHPHEMVHEPKVNIECVHYCLLHLECNDEVIHHICIT